MHTALSPDNPHGFNRYGFAWEKVPAGGPAHLDFGCFDGKFLDSLGGRGVVRRVGVDISRDAVAEAGRLRPHLEVIHITRSVPLPFADGTFSSVSALDVIEHIVEQAALLDEFHRVLRPGGVLIVTVPGQHLFSALDAGNFKFRFPQLHRWYYCRRHSREEYERRYVSNPDGLVGDVSAAKRWHEHFSRDRLTRLLAQSGFAVTDFDGTSFFGRPLSLLRLAVGPLRPLRRAMDRLLLADARRFESMNLFCAAERRDSPCVVPPSSGCRAALTNARLPPLPRSEGLARGHGDEGNPCVFTGRMPI